MAALGYTTTRALAAVTTGDMVIRETRLPGRFSPRRLSHIRVGTFELFASRGDGRSPPSRGLRHRQTLSRGCAIIASIAGRFWTASSRDRPSWSRVGCLRFHPRRDEYGQHVDSRGEK